MIYDACYMCDFETTVYDGQTSTEVWAAAAVRFGTEDVQIFHSINEYFDYIFSIGSNVSVFFHNLKFDGAFILDYLLNRADFKQAFDSTGRDFEKNKFMPNKSFKYLISDMGQWYSITIKYRNRIIQIQDSLKLLPFSVKRIGESFGTKHKKLDIEYKGLRFAGCTITEEEKAYIANDVLVVKEALEILFDEGHTKMTIASCALSEFENLSGGKEELRRDMPDLTKIQIDPNLYGADNADAYIRKAYKGGWCYVVKGKENRILNDGLTGDVNSLYPSMMSGESGNEYPLGKPKFWKGKPPEVGPERVPVTESEYYYFIRFRCRFRLRKGYLPTVQIKGTGIYKPTEWLETSDVFSKHDRKYHRFYINAKGEKTEAKPEMTMTKTDFILFREHYEIEDFECLDGCYFSTLPAGMIFDKYIEKYRKIKQESKFAKRELAKLFLNSLYGRLAAGTVSDFKLAFMGDESKTVQYVEVKKNDKQPGYIPIGAAITSYARNFTIRTAQKNYHGPDKPGFVYADTDSIHCDNTKPEDLIDVPIHPSAFCHWKIESSWNEGIFVRQKTYIEHITQEDLEPIDKPYFNVKCAGMPKESKELFIDSLSGRVRDGVEYTERQNEFISERRTLNDFKVGLEVPEAKLLPKRIPGGIILVPSDFKLRESFLF